MSERVHMVFNTCIYCGAGFLSPKDECGDADMKTEDFRNIVKLIDEAEAMTGIAR